MIQIGWGIQRVERADPLGSKFNVPPGRPPIHHPPFPHTNRCMYECPFSPFKYIYGEKSFLFRGRRHAIGLPISLHFRGNKSQTATNSESHWPTSSETFDSSIIYGTGFFSFFLSFSFLFFISPRPSQLNNKLPIASHWLGGMVLFYHFYIILNNNNIIVVAHRCTSR